MANPIPPPELPDSPYGGRGPLLMGITWSMAMIAIILMGLRTYTNFALVRNFGWDYFWAMVTLLSTLVGQIMQTVAVSYGLCNHIYYLTPAQIVAANKWTWLGQIVVLNAIGFGKIAIVAFLLRVQDGTHSKGKWFLYFVAVSGVIVNINQTVLMLTQCDPSARTWDKSLPGHCDHVNRTVRVGDFQGGWAAASDFALAIYPLIVYRKLKIPFRVRVAMFVLFGGGALAGAASAIKTVHIRLIGSSTDPTYIIYDLVVWGLVECWLVLILGCLPSLRALFVRMAGRIRAFTSRSNRDTHGYHCTKDDQRIAMCNRGQRSTADESHATEDCVITKENEIRKTTNIHISLGGASTNGNDVKDFATVRTSTVS